jgi:hypothetical protein
MGLIDRLKMGITLTRDSLSVMRHNPKLAVFPLVSAVTALVFLGAFLGTVFGLGLTNPEGSGLIVLFVVYLGSTFISTFFAAGLVHETRDAIKHGSEPSLRAGMAGAWEVKGPIFVWSVISATVSILINMLESSDSLPARLLATLFTIGWAILTFFVVPVIVFEKPGVGEMFKRSGQTFKQTWGETAISLIGVRLIAFLFVIPFVALGALLFGTSPLAGIGLILVGVLTGFLVGQTLQGIIKTALYMYATEGSRPEEFDNVDFERLAGDSSRSSRPRL